MHVETIHVNDDHKLHAFVPGDAMHMTVTAYDGVGQVLFQQKHKDATLFRTLPPHLNHRWADVQKFVYQDRDGVVFRQVNVDHLTPCMGPPAWRPLPS